MYKQNQRLIKIYTALAATTATGLGSGFSKYAPGTCGSLAALAVWLLLSYLGWIDHIVNQLLLVALVCVLGLISTRAYLRALQHRGSTDKDPGCIVIDEWVGTFLSLTGLSFEDYALWPTAFLLFRFYDVLKPGPVSWAERLPREWGIMLDDVVAGLLAALSLALIRFLFGL
ncbi:MAG: phosphatidylglycerophosphatase A [Deltaproteobacteria bacterium]|nr:phosphatidylglycerophosphatase A [Deltaproteobacteria bacterium]